MVTPENFWDKMAEKYSKKPIKDMLSYERTMDLTKKYLSEDMHALEIACGTGSTALLLAEHVNDIVATDISKNMVDIAKNKAKLKEVKNVTFDQSTLFENTLEKESFNAVMAFNFLHLVEDVAGSVAEINKLLKSEGVFISKTVCIGGGFSIWKPVIFVMKKLGLAPYVNFLRFEDMESYVENNGFKIIEKISIPEGSTNRFIVAKKI